MIFMILCKIEVVIISQVSKNNIKFTRCLFVGKVGTRTKSKPFYQCTDLKWQSIWETGIDEMTLNLVPINDVVDLSHGSDTSHSQREKKFPSSVVVIRAKNESLSRWLIPFHFPLAVTHFSEKSNFFMLNKSCFFLVLIPKVLRDERKLWDQPIHLLPFIDE